MIFDRKPSKIAKAVRFTTLEAICRTLDCRPGDVLRWVPDEQSADGWPQMTASAAGRWPGGGCRVVRLPVSCGRGPSRRGACPGARPRRRSCCPRGSAGR
ncbi:helix-turn-helix domain-containing protein [Streptomyces niger]|uniref:helix-turn-helix domain-containing protein n=1 Tax=Streptomyces niger TaxID=66373 RepID=UPI00389A6F7B